jgi:hypothetical protein
MATTANTHALGRERKFFAKTETTAATFAKPAATNAVKALTLKIAKEKDFKVRADSRQTRSALERIQGKARVTWEAEGYLMGSGTAGTPPDVHELLSAILATYANVPATSDTYSPASSQTLPTLSLVDHRSNVLMESAKGCWVEELAISVSGGEEPKIKFSGAGMGYAWTGYSTLNGGVATGASTFTPQSADSYNFNVDSVVKIGDDDNSGAGYQITQVNRSTHAMTFTPVLAGAGESNAEAVTPFAPSETTAGSPIAGITGSITIGGTACPITSFELSVKNNVKPMDDEAFAEFPTDAIPKYRTVTGTIGIRIRRDIAKLIANREALTTRAIVVTFGGTAGARCVVTMSQAELDFSAVETPDEDEATISLPFVAMATGTNENELSLAFT